MKSSQWQCAPTFDSFENPEKLPFILKLPENKTPTNPRCTYFLLRVLHLAMMLMWRSEDSLESALSFSTWSWGLISGQDGGIALALY